MDPNTELQIENYQTKINDISKKISNVKEQYNTTLTVVSDIDNLRKTNLKNPAIAQYDTSLLYVIQILNENLESYLKKNEVLSAQMQGYMEFINKLEDNKQLDLGI